MQNYYCRLTLLISTSVGRMSFPLPDHLPRQLDVSSNVLSKFDSVTLQSLNSSFASSCKAELDESIRLTKVFSRYYMNSPWSNGLD